MVDCSEALELIRNLGALGFPHFAVRLLPGYPLFYAMTFLTHSCFLHTVLGEIRELGGWGSCFVGAEHGLECDWGDGCRILGKDQTLDTADINSDPRLEVTSWLPFILGSQDLAAA